MTPRVFCIAAAFGELGRGGWQFAGPWVADRPEIASAQAVATYMQQNPAVAQLPLTAITVSEVPVEAIRSWLDGIDKAVEAEKNAESEKVVRWPVVGNIPPDALVSVANDTIPGASQGPGTEPPEPAA